MPGFGSYDYVVPFSVSGALAAGVVAFPVFIVPEDANVLFLVASVETAPATDAIILNLQDTPEGAGGAAYNLWTTVANQPTIAAGATRSYSFTTRQVQQNSAYALNDPQPGGTVTLAPEISITTMEPGAGPDTPLVRAGDQLALDVVQVGVTTTGSNLSVWVYLEKA